MIESIIYLFIVVAMVFVFYWTWRLGQTLKEMKARIDELRKKLEGKQHET